MRSKVENFLSLKILKIASNMKIPNENKIKFSDIVNKLLVKKVSDVFTDKDGFILIKVEDILNFELEFSIY